MGEKMGEERWALIEWAVSDKTHMEMQIPLEVKRRKRSYMWVFCR
jgi:hypothetical protein